MSSLLNIGLTGLNASQAYLNTTSHNIANTQARGNGVAKPFHSCKIR